MTDLTQLPDDVQTLILRNLAAANIACDLLEQHTGKSSATWGAIVSLGALRVVELLTPEDRASLLLLAQKLDGVDARFTATHQR